MKRKYNRIKPYKTKYQVDESYFYDINDENKAYWLGFLYADGSIRVRNKAYEFGLQLKGEDINHIEKLKAHLKSNHPIKTKEFISNYNGKKLNSCYFYIAGKIFCEGLIKHGCVPLKTHILKFPELNDKLIRHFIRGFFDGDGCISINKSNMYFHIPCASKLFLDKIHTVLTLIGINTKIHTRKDGLNYIIISLYNQNNFKIINNFLYKEATVCLERKKEIFLNLEKNYDEIRNRIQKVHLDRITNRRKVKASFRRLSKQVKI